MNFPICGSDILKLLPQRPPILVVDALLDFSKTRITTRYTIKDDCLFVNDCLFSEFGMIENMAQSSATIDGFINAENDLPPKIGFIGEVKDFTLFSLPKIGETLITTVNLIANTDNVSLVSAFISYEIDPGNILAQTKLKIFVQND